MSSQEPAAVRAAGAALLNRGSQQLDAKSRAAPMTYPQAAHEVASQERQQAVAIANQWLAFKMNPLTQMVPGDPDCDACVLARQFLRVVDTMTGTISEEIARAVSDIQRNAPNYELPLERFALRLQEAWSKAREPQEG